MRHRRLIEGAARYYGDRFAEHGDAPRGVDWNDEVSQRLRFDRLLDVVDDLRRPFSLTDFGCGYGALVAHLAGLGADFTYQGYDVSEPLLHRARELHEGPRRTFTADEATLMPTEYAVASGVFNVKQESGRDEWTKYVVDQLRQLAALGTCGFSFNMLTSYSDAEKMRADLYYGDPCFFFDLCKREFSRNVALVHDYGLWEFTILVRKEPRT